MMRLDALREMIIEARCSEATAPPFPSGVAAGDNRTGFLNASEAGRCTRWLWYDKHERRPAVFVEMLGKVAAAFDADSAAEVTAEGVITKQCVICPYRSRCVAAQMHAIPAAGTGGLDLTTLHAIDRLIAARGRAVEAEEEAARARAEVEAEIVATLTQAGANRIKRNGYAVRLKPPVDGFAALEIRSA
jgi:hypothetical protein